MFHISTVFRHLQRHLSYYAFFVLTLSVAGAFVLISSTIYDQLYVRELEFVDDYDLYRVGWSGPNPNMEFSLGEIERDADGLPIKGYSFPFSLYQRVVGNSSASAVAYAFWHYNRVVLHDTSGVADVLLVSDNYFDALRIPVPIGRSFGSGGSHEALVSRHYWRSCVGDVDFQPGKVVTIQDRTYSVVGITPDEVSIQQNLIPDLVIRINDRPDDGPITVVQDTDKGWWVNLWFVVSRDAETWIVDRSVELLKRELGNAGIGISAAKENRGTNSVRDESRERVNLLLWIVGLMCLSATCNVFGLKWIIDSKTRKDLAIKEALGRRKPRLVFEMVLQGLLLSVISLALGVLLYRAIGNVMTYSVSGHDFMTARRGMDLTLATVSGAFLLVILVFASIESAILVHSYDLPRILSGTYHSLPDNRLVNSVVFVVQATIAFVFLILFSHSFSIDEGHRSAVSDWNLSEFDQLGFIPASEDSNPVQNCLEEIGAAIPDRKHDYSFTTSFPYSGSTRTTEVLTDREHVLSKVEYQYVDDNYWGVTNTKFLIGGGFSSGDQQYADSSCVVNQSFVDAAYEGAYPIGKSFVSNEVVYHVIGVVEDSNFRGLGYPPIPCVYFQISRMPVSPFVMLYNRSTGNWSRAVENILIANGYEVGYRGRADAFFEVQIKPFSTMKVVSLCVSAFLMIQTVVSLMNVIQFQLLHGQKNFAIRVVLGATVSRLVNKNLAVYAGLVALSLTFSFIVVTVLKGYLIEIQNVQLVSFWNVLVMVGFALFLMLVVYGSMRKRLDDPTLLECL